MFYFVASCITKYMKINGVSVNLEEKKITVSLYDVPRTMCML